MYCFLCEPLLLEEDASNKFSQTIKLINFKLRSKTTREEETATLAVSSPAHAFSSSFTTP